jgi:hypothetical protein
VQPSTEPAPPPSAGRVELVKEEKEKEAKATPAAPPVSPQPRKKKRKADARATRRTGRRAVKPPSMPTPYKIEVYVDPQSPVVEGLVLTKGKKQFAVRSWELTDEGIVVTCRCEKWYRCPVDGTVLEPADASGIEAQIEAQIEELRQEYGISARRVFRYAIVRGASRQVTRVVLRGEWRRER